MGMSEQETRNKELVLAPFTYAYMQDTTKGQVKIFTGPTVINQTAQEVPVVYNPETGEFERCDSLRSAVRKSPIAVEGFYLVLFNPASDNKNVSEAQPDEGVAGKPAPELDKGRRVNLPGPAMFPLWPGQAAHYIRGHHLRSNQYLLVRVYNEEEARRNWAKAVVKPATGSDSEDSAVAVVTSGVPDDLSVGKLFVVKGTEVSFYIPPTGVTVVKASASSVSNSDPTMFVRDALTLERLEYCILVEENGNKRYEHGPKVVFPEPTEKFIVDSKGNSKSRAIELNEIQGIHLKVIADYVDENGKSHSRGDELFLTGKDVQIYYPREEHSLINYDGRSKHFATAIPAGEARYVMDRMTGEIETVKGPAMLLPDPRKSVIVRRVLSDKQCRLWYPNNDEVFAYNQSLREVLTSAPTTRSGAVSEGDYERSRTGKKKSSGRRREMSYSSSQVMAASLMPKAIHGAGGGELQGDEFTRSATYTQPRSITINTKLQGVPSIDVWMGHAVLIVSKTGKRRVVVGPDTILLDYDESMTVLELSSGSPKNTDNPVKTVYLRVNNNKVSDRINAETSDHVRVAMKLSYRVCFEGDNPVKWFEVDNYIKFFTEHCRSVIKAAIKKTKIGDFYADSTDFIRSTVLGLKPEEGDRKGMFFEENGMRIADIEVLEVEISDRRIQQLLDESQHQVVKTNIEVANQLHSLAAEVESDKILDELGELRSNAAKKAAQRKIGVIAAELETVVAGIKAEASKAVEQRTSIQERLATTDLEHSSKLARVLAEGQQKQQLENDAIEAKIQVVDAETQAMVSRFEAAQSGFSEALLSLSSNETMVKVAESLSVQNFIGGRSFVDVVEGIFKGGALEPMVKRVTARVLAQGDGNGTKPSATAKAPTTPSA
jgi:major vault protein